MPDNTASSIKNFYRSIFGNPHPGEILPGLIAALSVTAIAFFLHDFIGTDFGSFAKAISPLTIAVVLGLFFRNLFRLPESFQPGIKFCLEKLLRLGIVLLGIRLSIFAVFKIGLSSLIIIVFCILGGLLITTWAAKLLGLGIRLGSLIAVGTGICGISAIVATAPLINAKEEETAYAVSVITIFGTTAMFLYPYLANFLFEGSHMLAGIFLGSSVHDTSCVTGAGMIYDHLFVTENVEHTGLDVAIITKLIRNSMMLIVLPVMGFITVKRMEKDGESKPGEKGRLSIPLFILGFLLMAALRSFGDYLIVETEIFWDPSSWEYCWSSIQKAGSNILVVALAGLGLNTDIKKLKVFGYKPFAAGLCAAVAVGGISFLLLKFFGAWITFN